MLQADLQENAEKGESQTEEKPNQEPDTETIELMTVLEKYPEVILTLMVRPLRESSDHFK